MSKGEKEEVAGQGILSQDLIGIVIEEEEQKEADTSMPRGRSRGRQHDKMDKLELIQTQTEKKRESNKSR